MEKILIISSTRNSNFDMSKKIKSFFDGLGPTITELICLEDFSLPLFTPTLEMQFKNNNDFPENIGKIKDLLLSSKAVVWCSPEYNGGISPILTNSIAWISRATTDWKEAFINKKMLICSSSGGNGKNFVEGLRLQLKYLGSEVMEDCIIQTKKQSISENEFNEKLSQFYKNLPS